MTIHNFIEDIVLDSVKTIFNSIQAEGNPEKFCFCEQCCMDTACYALNRSEPHYFVSNRGVIRLEQGGLERQQLEADIASLIHEGLRRVKHNQRQTSSHGAAANSEASAVELVYDIPVIVGRIFDGATFAPMSGVNVELRRSGELVPMRNSNWQNPFTLVSNTAGSFSFWPKPILAKTLDDHKIFEFSVKVEAPSYETITHFFKIPVISNKQASVSLSISIEKKFKLPDLYLFAPEADTDV